MKECGRKGLVKTENKRDGSREKGKVNGEGKKKQGSGIK